MAKVIQLLGLTDPTAGFTVLSTFTKAEDYENLDCDANTSAVNLNLPSASCVPVYRTSRYICSVIAAGAYDTSKCATEIEVLV